MRALDARSDAVRKCCTLVKVLVIYLSVYVLAYLLNSAMGGYWLVAERDGRHLLFGLLSRTDAVMWQPRFGHNALGQTDYLGCLFHPLISIDRAWVHRTQYTIDDDFDAWLERLPVSEVHPHMRDAYRTTVTVTAMRDDDNQVLRCTLRLTGSDRPRILTEIKLPRELATVLEAAPPAGFIEMPYEAYLHWRNARYVRWIGRLPLARDQEVALAIPAKRPKAGTGRIVFKYEYDDEPKSFYSISTVELDPE